MTDIDKNAGRDYDAGKYWKERFSKGLTIAQTGHSGFSAGYNGYMYALKRRSLELAMRRHKIAVKGKSVLDVGCGSGFFLDFYARKGAGHLAGIDITEASVNAMREKFPSGSFFRMDACGSREPLDGTFDIVNVFDVLYHIIDDGAFGRAIANIGAWSDKGSWIFITDSLDPSKSAADHVRYRNPETYSPRLENSGIEIVETAGLFNFMGRPLSPGIKNAVLRRLAARAVESLAWAAYMADLLYCPPKLAHMRLMICRKR
jgi:SAM-dependent methyltransferase